MADETKDVKKEEHISPVLRCHNRGAVKESFLDFEAAEHLNAAGLADKIIRILEKYELEYRDSLIGQAYDGASIISGKNSGVQARVKQVATQAFYVHCNAHCVDLVLVDTVKAVPEVECFFSLVPGSYTFMSGGQQKKDNFHAGLFYPVLDHLLTEINGRFSKQNCQVRRGVQALNPSNASFSDGAAQLPFCISLRKRHRRRET